MAFTSFFSAVFIIIASFLNALFPLPASGIPGREGTAVTTPLGGGCDPCFMHAEGRYYRAYPLGNGVGVNSSETLSDLFDAPGRRVYTAPADCEYSSDYWAPEIHYIEGRWYIYVCADDGKNENHRMYVLSCDTPDGDYVMEGKITDSTDKWAIDGTVMQYDGGLWFIWSGWEGDTDGGQNLYIAHMSDPLHIDGERVRISAPLLPWERKGMPVNEAPAVLYHQGKVFLFYSASGSWTDDYCLGMLTLCGRPDSPFGWVKSPLPVLTKAETAYGPGHCCFVQSGGEDYIVYHANLESGTGWNARSIRIQPVMYRRGLPVILKPAAENEKVIIQ